jgi:carnitine O-palmitoyltransferase 2
MQDTIRDVRDAFVDKTKSLTVHGVELEHFGKKLLKTKKLSPDSVMQLGIQLAQMYTSGNTAATYESCSTAAFRHGRTETVRPATAATRAFCEAVTAEGVSKNNAQKLFGMLGECSKVHGQLTKEAAMGQGFDRHLFAMKHFVEGPMPGLYLGL